MYSNQCKFLKVNADISEEVFRFIGLDRIQPTLPEMVTTVGGLIVGILAMFAYNLLVSRIDRVDRQLESRTMEFMDLLNEPA